MKLKVLICIVIAALLLSLAACAERPEDGGEKDVIRQVTAENLDGEIKSKTNSPAAAGRSYTGELFDDCGMATEAAIDIAEAPGELMPDYIVGDERQYNAGTLTAGEWRDNDNYSEWRDKFQQADWTQIADSWNVRTLDRVAVTLVCGDSSVGAGVPVRLYDADGKLVWRGVSDHNGHAYLFAPAGHAARVEADLAGVSASADCTGKGEVELSFNVRYQPAGRGLDLMLVVDTTGSMGDELEYLKAELKDVVVRAQKQSGVSSVRTSVNFYRDEGDEYVVRYFGFRDDIDEAIGALSEQQATGGGDYPEAVHTALENAVEQHAWNEDSIKLMFLVLDAPPHLEDGVVESINASLARAAELGIRIIPVVASGTDTNCEVLYRSMAMLTGGTYVFLTDDSGIGNPHAEPQVGQYETEKLNDLMVRLIAEYCG